jgi:hypothetical protein
MACMRFDLVSVTSPVTRDGAGAKASRDGRLRLQNGEEFQPVSVKLRNYQMRLIAALTAGAVPDGGIGQVAVQHERKCPIFRGGVCSCTPDISINTGDSRVAFVAPDGSVSRLKRS